MVVGGGGGGGGGGGDVSWSDYLKSKSSPRGYPLEYTVESWLPSKLTRRM